MERDFLGIGGKDSGDLVKGDRQDSAVDWPLFNKISSLQQFPALNTTQEKPKNSLFHQNSLRSIAAVVAMEANQKACVSQAPPQKSFGLERHGMQKFFNPVSLGQDMSNYCCSTQDTKFASVSHYSDPVASKDPSFTLRHSSSGPGLAVTTVKLQRFGSGFAGNNPWLGSADGVYAPSKVQKPPTTTSQLTIFYAGSVNVYDDVPLEKAQAVLLMANEAYKKTASAMNPKVEESDSPFANRLPSDGRRVAQALNAASNYKMPQCSSIPTTLALASHKENQLDGNSLPMNSKIGAKGNEATILASQNDPSNGGRASMGVTTASTILPRAVPQARKASLTRFLEKRKERVNTAMPYSVDKAPPESSIRRDVASSSSKSSSGQASVSSGQDCSWLTGEEKTSDCNGRAPNTKLEM